jgi:hypothetical protein
MLERLHSTATQPVLAPTLSCFSPCRAYRQLVIRPCASHRSDIREAFAKPWLAFTINSELTDLGPGETRALGLSLAAVIVSSTLDTLLSQRIGYPQARHMQRGC